MKRAGEDLAKGPADAAAESASAGPGSGPPPSAMFVFEGRSSEDLAPPTVLLQPCWELFSFAPFLLELLKVAFMVELTVLL